MSSSFKMSPVFRFPKHPKFPGNFPKVVHHGQRCQYILNVPLGNISGTLFQFIFSFTGWEHCDHTTRNTAKYTVNEPLGNIMGAFFGKILGLPIYYLTRTLWSHDLEHCKHTTSSFSMSHSGKLWLLSLGNSWFPHGLPNGNTAIT